MRKLFIPAICLLISFAFSGATISKKSKDSPAFSSSIHILNWSSATVTSVQVEVLSTSSVTNYPNPTFPILHNTADGDIRITYYLSGSGAGCTRWEGGGACIFTPYNGSNSDTYVTVSNNGYTIYLEDGCSGICS